MPKDFSINFETLPGRKVKNVSAAVKARRRNNATTTNQALGATAAGVALVPGGAIVAGVIGLGAALNSLFNANSMALPANQMWLCAYYQYWVLGQSGVTSDHKANAIYYAPAVQWFSNFTGLPIIDITQLWSLKGTNSGFVLQNYTLAQRVKNYRQSIINSNTGFLANALKSAVPNNAAVQALNFVPSVPDVNIQLACLLSDALETPAQLGNKGIPAYWAQVYDMQPTLIQNAISSGKLSLPPASASATAQTPPAQGTTTTVVNANPLTSLLGTIQKVIGVPSTTSGQTVTQPLTGAQILNGDVPPVIVPGAGTVTTTANPGNLALVAIVVIVLAILIFK